MISVEKNKKLVFLLVLFLIIRVFFLLNANIGTEPMGGEEAGRRGVVAYKWLESGPGFPANLFTYGESHQLGVILQSIVTVVFFKIFGISFPALMAVVVLEGFLLTFLIYKITSKYFGKESAFWTTLLGVVSFPTWLFATTSQPATILTGLLMSVLIVYRYIRFLEEGEIGFLTGFIVGASVFIEPLQPLLTLGVILVHWLFFTERNTGKSLVRPLTGMFTGLLPRIYFYTAQTSDMSSALLFHGRPIFNILMLENIKKFPEIISYVVDSFGFQNQNMGVLNIFLFGLLTLGIAKSLKYFWDNRDSAGYEKDLLILSTMIIAANMVVLLVTEIGAAGIQTGKGSLVHRRYQYVALTHTYFFILTGGLFSRAGDIMKSFLKLFFITLILASAFIIPGFAETDKLVYDPVPEEFYSVFKDEDIPARYKRVKNLVTLFRDEQTDRLYPRYKYKDPFTRSVDSMEETCRKGSFNGYCYRLLGIHFHEVRRFEPEQSLKLCRLMESKKGTRRCIEGASMSEGYYTWNRGTVSAEYGFIQEYIEKGESIRKGKAGIDGNWCQAMAALFKNKQEYISHYR